jgi:hypothetical protein
VTLEVHVERYLARKTKIKHIVANFKATAANDGQLALAA